MATLTLDTVQEAQLVADYSVREYTRTGFIDDIDLSSGNDPEALVKVLPYLPSFGSGLSVNFPSYILQRIVVRPSTTKFRRCYVQLIYSTFAGGSPGAYIIRNRGFLGQFETDFLPGTRVPIKVGWERDIDGKTYKIDEDTVTMNLPRPMREIAITALVAGEPNEALQDAVGCVNLGLFRGKPTGYFLVTGVETDYAKYGGYYQFQATALTKVNEDWGFFGILQSKHDGRLAKVDETIRASLANQPYSYGVHTVGGGGLVRVDPFVAINLTSLFGVS